MVLRAMTLGTVEPMAMTMATAVGVAQVTAVMENHLEMEPVTVVTADPLRLQMILVLGMEDMEVVLLETVICLTPEEIPMMTIVAQREAALETRLEIQMLGEIEVAVKSLITGMDHLETVNLVEMKVAPPPAIKVVLLILIPLPTTQVEAHLQMVMGPDFRVGTDPPPEMMVMEILHLGTGTVPQVMETHLEIPVTVEVNHP